MSTMLEIKNQRGQALMEASVATLVVVTLVLAFLTVCYLAFSSYWIKHNLYESLICYEATHKTTPCEYQAKIKIQKIISLPQEESIRIEALSQKAISRLRFYLHLPLLNSELQKIQFEESVGI